MQSKTPENSKAIQTDLVLPGDTNSLNSFLGESYWQEWIELLV